MGTLIKVLKWIDFTPEGSVVGSNSSSYKLERWNLFWCSEVVVTLKINFWKCSRMSFTLTILLAWQPTRIIQTAGYIFVMPLLIKPLIDLYCPSMCTICSYAQKILDDEEDQLYYWSQSLCLLFIIRMDFTLLKHSSLVEA